MPQAKKERHKKSVNNFISLLVHNETQSVYIYDYYYVLYNYWFAYFIIHVSPLQNDKL